jgi:type IV pilus assembly protein PilM
MISSGKKIGVDAGTSLVKIIELSKSGDGVGVANWSFMPFRLPANAPPESITQVQAKAIDAAIKKCDCKCRDIVVGVPGNSAFIRNIKLPPVPASKIDQIVRYEIQQTIPFPIENIALDYQVLEPDETSEVEVIMVAMKGEMAEAFINDVEQAKVRVGIMDSIPLALYNCYRYNEYSSKEECTAIMELGASSSNILIELSGELRYCRSVSIGGNDITEAIAKELNIPFQQAERIKIQHGIIFPDSQAENVNADVVRVSKAITGVLERLLGEVKLTIGYFRSLTGATAISRAVLAGGSAMLKNVRPFLADRLGVQVEILNPFKKVGVPKNLVNVRKAAPMFATAVGLALRSSGDCCQLKISLIPPKLKEAKSRRVKVICNAVSALLVAAIAGFYMVASVKPIPEIEAQVEKLDKKISKYAEYEETLINLTSERDLLRLEFVRYGTYPTTIAVDAVTPLAVLKEAVKGDVWIKSLDFQNSRTLSITGAIESGDQRVEGMRQLSELRTDLETYCGPKQINVVKQGNTDTGLSFTLKSSNMPDMGEFLKKQAEERQKAAEKKAEEQKAEEAKEQEKDALEQAPKANESEEHEAEDKA